MDNINRQKVIGHFNHTDNTFNKVRGHFNKAKLICIIIVAIGQSSFLYSLSLSLPPSLPPSLPLSLFPSLPPSLPHLFLSSDEDMMSISSQMSVSNLSTIGFLEDDEDDSFGW